MPRVSSSTLAHLPPRTLRWARESTGYSARQAADKLGVHRWEIEGAEQGEHLLTLRQAETLARMYGRPLALLFLPEPPYEEPQEAQFRRLPGAPEPPWPPEMHKLSRQIRERQAAAEELHELLEETPAWVDAADELAGVGREVLPANVRSLLGVSVDKQRSWLDPYGYTGLRAWVDAVEGVGVLVMQDGSMPVETLRGFAAVHETVPVIVTNTKDDARARVFTLIHEFGHLALAAIGVETGPETEAWCEEFAGQLLLPTDELRAVLDRAHGSPLARVDRVALEFGVTPFAAAVRLKRTRLLKRDEADEAIELIKARPHRQRSKGGDYYRNKVTWLGPSFVRLVLEAVDAQAVTLSNAAGLLGAKVNQFQRLRETVDQRAEFG
jgi:Zn-dependent peptidase ImmA (M78 family)